LSPREREVVVLVARGHTNRQIAEALIISERTVGNHVMNIYGKIGATDRAQAIVYAIKQGLVRV